jgi:hypothetical protein
MRMAFGYILPLNFEIEFKTVATGEYGPLDPTVDFTTGYNNDITNPKPIILLVSGGLMENL